MEQKYRNLWAAVLKQAIKDSRQCSKDSFNNPRLWFISESQEVGSFLWICAVLNIDPELIGSHCKVEMKQAA